MGTFDDFMIDKAVKDRAKEELMHDQISALKATLREIVHEYDQTYDAECGNNGRWTGAASIPVHLMERAKALVK